MTESQYPKVHPVDYDGNIVSGGGGTTGGATEATLVQVRDRLPSALVGDRLKVDAGSVDTELPTAIALSDTLPNPTAPAVGAYNLAWDGTQWGRLSLNTSNADAQSNTDNRLKVNARLQAFNGTTWDRLRSGQTGAIASVVGIQNTLPAGRYNATSPTLTDGQHLGLQLDVNGRLSVATRYTQQLGTAFSATAFSAIAGARVADPATPPTYTAGLFQAPTIDLNGALLTNGRSLTAARDTVAINAKRGSFSDRSGTITTGGTAQQLAPANANRSYFLIQNLSTGDLWINFGVTAIANQPSIRLPAGGNFILEASAVSTELISVFGATTGQAFTAKEMS